jgi:acyl carrier protein
MTTTTDARQAVQHALHRVVPEADLTALDDDADLRDELELDSLDFLAFAENLSTATGTPITEDDYPNLRTVAAVVAFLTRPR